MQDLAEGADQYVHPFARTTLEAQLAALELEVNKLSELQQQFSRRIDEIGEVTETWMPR